MRNKFGKVNARSCPTSTRLTSIGIVYGTRQRLWDSCCVRKCSKSQRLAWIKWPIEPLKGSIGVLFRRNAMKLIHVRRWHKEKHLLSEIVRIGYYNWHSKREFYTPSLTHFRTFLGDSETPKLATLSRRKPRYLHNWRNKKSHRLLRTTTSRKTPQKSFTFRGYWRDNSFNPHTGEHVASCSCVVVSTSTLWLFTTFVFRFTMSLTVRILNCLILK